MLEKLFGKKVKDERVTELSRRVAGEGFWILLFGLFLIVGVKIFVFHQRFPAWGAEWVLAIAAAIYVCVRSVVLAIPLTTRKMKVNVKVLAALLSAVILWAGTLGLGSLGGALTAEMLIRALPAGVFAALLTYFLLSVMEKLIARRNKKLSGDL